MDSNGNKNETFKTRLQLWATILTTAITFGTIGYALVSELHILKSEMVLVKERQNVNTNAIAQFMSPGPRFTRQDGDKIQIELDRIADRLRVIEGKVIIIEDRATRRKND